MSLDVILEDLADKNVCIFFPQFVFFNVCKDVILNKVFTDFAFITVLESIKDVVEVYIFSKNCNDLAMVS